MPKMKAFWDKDADWELKMAFVRLDFPPAQRDTAQCVAAAFGHLIGPAILRLRPEHTLGEIMSWSESHGTIEILMALEEEFLGGEMDLQYCKAPNRLFTTRWLHLSWPFEASSLIRISSFSPRLLCLCG